MTYPADSIEEMIKLSAMCGLTTNGLIARFVGCVLRDDKANAEKLWWEMVDLRKHLDDIDCQEIENWVFN